MPDTGIYVATRSASSAWSIGWRRSSSWAARWSRHGGQNPIEAVRLGAAILHGPHVWNFAEIYAALDARMAPKCRRSDADGTPWRSWPPSGGAQRVADAARTVGRLGGALERTVARWIPI